MAHAAVAASLFIQLSASRYMVLVLGVALACLSLAPVLVEIYWPLPSARGRVCPVPGYDCVVFLCEYIIPLHKRCDNIGSPT